jgi:putative oxidoreductase
MTSIRRIEKWLLNPPTTGHPAILLPRLMAGGVFVSEGIMKFIFPSLGVGRFALLGFPLPHATASFVAGLEIVGGSLLMTGLVTRLVAIPFVIEMVVAILSTKITLYLGTSPLPLPPAPPVVGLWAVLHDSRSDYAQLLTSLFLAIVGPGQWSLDARWRRWRERIAIERGRVSPDARAA